MVRGRLKNLVDLDGVVHAVIPLSHQLGLVTWQRTCCGAKWSETSDENVSCLACIAIEDAPVLHLPWDGVTNPVDT